MTRCYRAACHSAWCCVCHRHLRAPQIVVPETPPASQECIMTPSVILGERKGHESQREKGPTVFEDPPPGGSRLLSTRAFGSARWRHGWIFGPSSGAKTTEGVPRPVSREGNLRYSPLGGSTSAKVSGHVDSVGIGSCSSVDGTRGL
ncbi:hypothetical protein K0M31_010748 [Melipona bicolor]|uniref:Uncharacterized protein n=1 Tax=Melipona bicolor TaxID=60889 RepID=A0AA40FKT4_9HYME|nr:hypothetical protein K0M31_010748 [Melipona bicolor]